MIPFSSSGKGKLLSYPFEKVVFFLIDFLFVNHLQKLMSKELLGTNEFFSIDLSHAHVAQKERKK